MFSFNIALSFVFRLLYSVIEMTAPEQLCLRWNEFQENVNTTFASLRKDSYFTDVTLACEDGQQFDTHKVILAASSPYFENILKRNKHAHPLIYMSGVKSENILSIIDFLYYGEAYINPENLNSFLNIAENLEIQGLKGNLETFFNQTKEVKLNKLKVEEEEGEIDEEDKNSVSLKRSTLSTKVLFIGEQEKNSTCGTKFNLLNDTIVAKSYSTNQHNTRWSDVRQDYSSEFKILDEQIETMISCIENVEKGKSVSRVYKCKVCGKIDSRHHLGDHIEVNHIKGIAIACKLCANTVKTVKSRNALRHHLRNHTN